MEDHSFEIVWSGPAKWDFEKIIAQTAQAAPMRATTFGEGLLRSIEKLRQRPHRYARLYETQICRYLLFKRYRAVFYIDEIKSIVYIIAILFPYQQFKLSRLAFVRPE